MKKADATGGGDIESELSELIRMTHMTSAECSLEEIGSCVVRRESLLRRLEALQNQGVALSTETRRLLGVLDGATSELMVAVVRCYRERFNWLSDRQPGLGDEMPLLNALLCPSGATV